MTRAVANAFHRSRLLAAIAVFVPGSAWAEVCDKQRPMWNPLGGPATMWDEALHLAATPLSLLLLLGTALAIRFRSQWGGLAAVVGWSFLVYFVAFGDPNDPTGITQAAMQEGCIGSPALFIAVVAAICVATVIYTAPEKEPSSD